MTLTIDSAPVGAKTIEGLTKVVNIVSRSGNPDQDFYYLGGPMTGIPQFNFPRFHYIADTLRAHGYNIVSPAELDDPETEKAAMQSEDGAPGSGSANGESWADFLSRDLIICALPTCKGGIFMEDWHRSTGAKLESYVLSRLHKPVFEYVEASRHAFRLVPMDRDTRLAELDALGNENDHLTLLGGPK